MSTRNQTPAPEPVETPGGRRRLKSRQDRTWMPEGSCWNLPAGGFVHDHDDRSTQLRLTKAAQAICAECPVAQLCLAYALENNEMFGVWGGTTPRARRKLTTDMLEVDDTETLPYLPEAASEGPAVGAAEDTHTVLPNLDQEGAGEADADLDLLLPDLEDEDDLWAEVG